MIVGASAAVLLASMFLLSWYGPSGTLRPAAAGVAVPTSVNGWNGLTNLRWLLLLTIGCSFALVFLQAMRRTPAIPVTFSVIVTVMGILTMLALIYRVLIDIPSTHGVDEAKAGAYVGLVSAIVLVYGGYVSMRQEGIAARDAPEVETVRLGSAPRA